MVVMAMESNESCSSRSMESSPSRTVTNNNNRQQLKKIEVYNEVLNRLKNSNIDEANQPGFDDELLAHFNRLPTRYMYTHALFVIIYCV